ncbi:unnamed protein product [Rotaria sp. Silwood1]|nr:unnamed protein product [Rotaria sp. Silwood1]CAF0962950.1 unnamed protein product [Rotaria sp. Silwood1]CAF3365843.1 unnamed protein product [Rotaria sp. Silwood1]CAF4975127.1 unnamed protein product [Rotaria sp. Silwood1]
MCIWIINYEAGEIVYQPIIQLFGFDSIYHETILVNNKYQWPIVQGLFKIYIELNPGENIIQLSTLTSQLSFTLLYSPSKTTNITLRLIYVSFSDTVDHDIENICKKFVLLSKLKNSSYINVKKDFEDKITGDDIFKEIYRQMYKTNLIQDSSVKLIIKSSISSSLTFAYTFNNIIVLNLPKEFSCLPISFDEFYESLNTNKVESLFYSVGAYLHELGHVFGLDHGNNQSLTIMSSSKGYIDSGKDFFLVSPHLCSIIYNQQCSCYKKPILSISCSYSNGVLSRHSKNLKCSCKSDIHCQFTLKFNQHKYNEKPNQCICNGQFQFDIDHCHRLIVQFDERK